jgi:YVTN family beta-propeller protein
MAFALAAGVTSLARSARAENDAPKAEDSRTIRFRQPAALAWSADGSLLFVANRRSGTLSIIDANRRTVVAEREVGRSLTDITLVPDTHRLLTVDRSANALILFDEQGGRLIMVERKVISADPVRVTVMGDGSLCVVSSLWSRRLTFIGLPSPGIWSARSPLPIVGTVDLPFCPLEMATFGDGSKLVVADAFGGRLAMIDVKSRAIDSVRTFPGHNIRGLAFDPSGKTLLITHQVLSRLAQTSFDDVHWGLLIRNQLRILRTPALLTARSDQALLDGSRSIDLGNVGYAAGDPGPLAIDRRGQLLIALAGVDEIAVTASPEEPLRRIVVGSRPSAILPTPDGLTTFVANAFDDTVVVVDTAAGTHLATISLGPQPALSAADRGERLFSSAKLSHDGWMSCQSCHTDGHTNGLLTDTLGDGSYGAPKRVPSLLGVASTGPWTWTGSVARLDDQVRKSIATTMHGPKVTDQQVSDLTAYLTTLAPPLPQVPRGVTADSASSHRGGALFERHKCGACHTPPEYTSRRRFDIGLDDEVGNREFNPPSLRAVSRRETLLHDGRARSLEDVFSTVRHPRGLVLSADEIADLVAFLKTL